MPVTVKTFASSGEAAAALAGPYPGAVAATPVQAAFGAVAALP